jgi:DNA-directed RNA polymerase specialized sigma24 family protein
MPDLTQLLNTTGSGDPDAAARLFELVHDDLRRLAAHRLAHEAPGQTLQATALVHEVYLRLVGEASTDTGTAPAISLWQRPCAASSSRTPPQSQSQARRPTSA